MERRSARGLRHSLTLGAAAFALSVMTYVMSAVAGSPEEAFFRTPSGNIVCEYLVAARGPMLTCYRGAPKYIAITLGPSGKAKVSKPEGDIGDTLEYDVLEYGTSWSRGPFTCSSTEAGLSCDREGRQRNGFFVSRGYVKTY